MQFYYDDSSLKTDSKFDLCFPTPIYSTTLSPSREVFDQMLSSSIIHGEKMNEGGLITGDQTGSYTIHNNSTFYWLNDEIKKHSKIYLDYLGVDTDLVNLHAQRSWIVHCDSNSLGVRPHVHTNCLLSAVYYLQCDKKTNGGTLDFYGTSPILKLPIRNYKKTKFSLKTVSYIPKVNKLIIFPSNITHSVSKYISKDKINRISATYDLMVTIKPSIDIVEGWVLDPSSWKKL